MTNPNDPFDEALEGADERFVSERAGDRQARWETRVITKLVTLHAGSQAAGDVLREMKTYMDELTGQPALTFDTFLQMYPNFPVWLVSRPIYRAFEKTGYGDFQTKYEHLFSKVWRECADAVPANAEGKPVGVVFEILNQNSQFNIVHNHRILNLYEPKIKGGRYEFYDPKSKLWLVFEPLDFFLDSIGWLCE